MDPHQATMGVRSVLAVTAEGERPAAFFASWFSAFQFCRLRLTLVGRCCRQRAFSIGMLSSAIRWRACIITASISRPMSSRRSAYFADSSEPPS